MKTKLFTIALILMGFGLSAQVAINTDDSDPNPSAMLDVKSTTQGLLIPRMDSAQRSTIISPANGLLVYQQNGIAPGFYFYNGNEWVILNAGTVNIPDSDKIIDADGDTRVQVEKNGDDDHIRFETKDTEAMVIDSMGNIGMGIADPKSAVHIDGGIKVDNFNQGNTLDSLVTWNPNDSTLRVIPTSSVGGGDALPLPDPAIPVPIGFQGDTLWVHPSDNANTVNWTTAVSTCDNLVAFGKDDWYTPNIIELDAIYKQSYLLTGLEQYNDWKYWSSTANQNDAFTRRMDYGGPDPDPQTDAAGHRVRCVRKNGVNPQQSQQQNNQK